MVKWGMEVEKMKDVPPEGGVRELWAGQLSDEVKVAFEKARVELGMGKNENKYPSSKILELFTSQG